MYAGRHALDRPGQPLAIMWPDGGTVSYGEYEDRCNRLAHLMLGWGLARGDHIAVLMENQPRLLEIQGAAERIGLYYTLVNTHLTAAEAAYIVADCQARVLFISERMSPLADVIAATCPEVVRCESYEAELAGQPFGPVDHESLGAAMLYSSGTTGQPKGILRPLPDAGPAEPLPVMAYVSRLYGFRGGMVYLSPAPLYHSAPQASISAAIRSGATCVIMEQFEPEAWLELVQRYRVTHTQMVPTMFSRLLRLPSHLRQSYDLSSLECLVHAAAPCPVPVKQAMIDWLGPIVREYYAATEANGFTLCDSLEWLKRPGTVGRAVLGSLEILDDDGAPCPAGVDGTIWFRGATNFEYFRDPDKTAASRSADGQASTVGDVGHVDVDGYLYLTDRKTNMIISGGVNIYPQETENVLATHPAVLDVAVIGIPDEDFGEQVRAVVQLAPDAVASRELAAELIAFCRERLTGFKCPRSVEFVTSLPRMPNGKLYKRLLR